VKIISEDDLLQMIETRPGDGATPKKPSATTSLPPPSPVKSKPVKYEKNADVDKTKTSLHVPPITDDSPSTPKLSIDELALMCMYSFGSIETFFHRNFS
jgi:hypothetical protein